MSREEPPLPNVVVINGPNLNLLGTRDPERYGTQTLGEIQAALEQVAGQMQVDLTFVTTNHEGEIVDAIQQASGQQPSSSVPPAAGIIINPAAYSHYSIAIRDAIEASPLPIVEVHLTNIYAREPFRQQSVISAVATGTITGLGPMGYLLALHAIVSMIEGR